MSTDEKRTAFIVFSSWLFWLLLGLFLGFMYGNWNCLFAILILTGLCTVVFTFAWLSTKIFKE